MSEKQGTKYGRQPFLDMLKDLGISYRTAALEMGVPYLHLRHAGYGYVTPKQELRRALTEYLELPIEDLFTGRSLEAVPRLTGPKRKRSRKLKLR